MQGNLIEECLIKNKLATKEEIAKTETPDKLLAFGRSWVKPRFDITDRDWQWLDRKIECMVAQLKSRDSIA